MVDKDLISFIVNESSLRSGDIILEIGFGHGELTKQLIKKCVVIAVDIDGEFSSNSENLKLVNANILDVFDDLKFTKIVSNIPYNISEPLMRKVFRKDIDLCVLTIGKNFADILTKKDNRIGILANNFYDIELLKVVKPRSFRPMPNTDSAIIRLEPKELEELDKKAVLYRQLIFLEEKKLKNALEKILADKTKRQVNSLTTSPIFKKKIYELSNKEFLELDIALDKVIE